jgi:hypothetical protein
MSDQFKNIIAKMQPLLDELLASPQLSRTELQDVPAKGVYVFYENGSQLYVGRSNRLRERVLEHSRPSSRHNSATFAFNLATEAATKARIPPEGRNRTELENYAPFRDLYRKAKGQVAAMKVQVIKIEDPIEQAIFEVYAALALHTAYNDFDNH